MTEKVDRSWWIGPDASPDDVVALKRRVAAALPPRQVQARARSLLVAFAQQTREETCPCCSERPGYLGDGPFDSCPLCKGFKEVPRLAARWFTSCMRALTASRPPHHQMAWTAGDVHVHGHIYGAAAERRHHFDSEAMAS